MTSTFFFGEDIDFCVKFGVRSDGSRLSNNLTALNIITFNTAQQNTSVVTSLTLIKRLLEGFDTGYNRFLAIFDTRASMSLTVTCFISDL